MTLNFSKDFLILSPIFNEEKLVPKVTGKAEALNYRKNVIFVDDGSKKDNTAQALQQSGAYFISFTENARKEGSVYNALQLLKARYGSLPEYLVTLDGDSYLAPEVTGTSVEENLTEGIRHMRESGFVARPIDIAVPLTPRSGILEWLQALKWYLIVKIRSFNSHILRMSPGLIGAGVIFKTQTFLDGMPQKKTGFEAGDTELSNIISSMGRIDVPLSSVSVQTRVFESWGDFFTQQKRWALGQLEGSPKLFFAAFASGLILFDAFILLNLPVFAGLALVLGIYAGTSWLIRQAVFMMTKFWGRATPADEEIRVQLFRDAFLIMPLLVIYETFNILYIFNNAVFQRLFMKATAPSRETPSGTPISQAPRSEMRSGL